MTNGMNKHTFWQFYKYVVFVKCKIANDHGQTQRLLFFNTTWMQFVIALYVSLSSLWWQMWLINRKYCIIQKMTLIQNECTKVDVKSSLLSSLRCSIQQKISFPFGQLQSCTYIYSMRCREMKDYFAVSLHLYQILFLQCIPFNQKPIQSTFFFYLSSSSHVETKSRLKHGMTLMDYNWKPKTNYHLLNKVSN
jgi:hypothetical protein